MEEGGAAVVIPDRELNEDRLGEVISGMLADENMLREMAAAARHLAKPDAGERIAREVLAAAEAGSP